MVMPTLEDVATTKLVRGSIEDTRELVRLELALAKDELLGDLHAARGAAIRAAATVVLALSGAACLLVALGVALGPVIVGAVGAALLCAAGVAGFAAYRTAPRALMKSTRRRIDADQTFVVEHLS
jgi:protein-S-isoprenylcysteine O-methyltransferase Ste14